jgi:hypothetical protein
MYLRLILIVFALFTACNPHIEDDGQGNRIVGQKSGEWELFSKNKTETKKVKISKSNKISIPSENIIESPEPPIPGVDTENRGRIFIKGLKGKSLKNTKQLFIPYKYFSKIKDMHMGDKVKENRALKKLYTKKINKFNKKMKKLFKKKDFSEATFESIIIGKCSWIARDNNWNKIAYWKCSRNRIFYHNDGERKFLKIKHLYNWGKKWFIVVF